LNYIKKINNNAVLITSDRSCVEVEGLRITEITTISVNPVEKIRENGEDKVKIQWHKIIID